jgi:stage III sporulation protein SpoIIIAA
MEAQLASASLAHRIKEQMPTASTLYYRLVLLVGKPRSGKTAALREFAAIQNFPVVNLNLGIGISTA